MPHRLWALGLALVLGCPRATPDTAAQGGAVIHEVRETRVGPQSAYEVNVMFDSGGTVAATYTVRGGALAWNVHSHPAAAKIVHEDGRGESGTVSFRAPAPGLYSFQWHNDTTEDVFLSARFEGSFARVAP